MQHHHHAPAHVKFGVDRENLEHFNDLIDCEKAGPGPYKIKSIKVQWNKDHVLGTEFHYVTKDGKHVEGHNITKFKPFKELFGHVHSETFEIDDDDELLEIHAWVAARINKIGFKTYRGKHKAFGHEHGEFVAHAYPGHTFGIAKGGFGDHLDFLEVHTHHLPEARHHLKVLIIKE